MNLFSMVLFASVQDNLVGGLCYLSAFGGFVGLVYWHYQSLEKLKKEEAAKMQKIAKMTEAAKTAYEESLARLRKDPNNASLRHETLKLGRAFSYLTRNQTGVPIYAEVAIKNDIDAACAGAVMMAKPEEQTERETVKQRIANLDELREAGMISDVEYNERRKRILDSI